MKDDAWVQLTQYYNRDLTEVLESPKPFVRVPCCGQWFYTTSLNVYPMPQTLWDGLTEMIPWDDPPMHRAEWLNRELLRWEDCEFCAGCRRLM